MIEVCRARCRHAVLFSQEHLSRNPRMVHVEGATMISFKRSMTSSGVSTRTGRRLSLLSREESDEILEPVGAGGMSCDARQGIPARP